MTSYVGREEVENQLWKSGIRSNVIMKQLLLVIDAYAYNVARKLSEPLEDVPADEFAELLPGEADTTAKVTRCVNCLRVKPWKPGFFVEKMSPTGFGTTCRYCTRLAREGPKDSRSTPGKTDRLYYCRKCDFRKPLEMFPEAKQEKPTIVSWCSYCIDTYGDPKNLHEKRRRWKCRFCGQVKDEDQFPEEKRVNPKIAAYCTWCDARHGGFAKKRSHELAQDDAQA